MIKEINEKFNFMKNYFEYKDDKSSKFWEISLSDKTVTTRYGKIGTPGQVSEKIFEEIALAEKEYNKLITEKIKKGYLEILITNSEIGINKEILDLIDAYNKINLEIFKDLQGSNHNVLTKYNPATNEEILELEHITNIKLPQDLVNFYKTIGGLYNVDNYENHCFEIGGCTNLIKSLQKPESDWSRTKSIGLMDEILQDLGYDEEQTSEIHLSEQQIEQINNNYKCIGLYRDCNYQESAYFIYFDKIGKFGQIYCHQDTADQTFYKLEDMIDESPANKTLNEILKNALLEITVQLVSWNS